MAKDKRDFQTMDLIGIPKQVGRPNRGMTKTSAEYKKAQRSLVRENPSNVQLTTRTDCMYVLSKPLYFTHNQRKNAWLKIAELDGYALNNLDCPINFSGC